MKHTDDFCKCNTSRPYKSKCMRCGKWIQDDRQRKRAKAREWAGCEEQRERA